MIYKGMTSSSQALINSIYPFMLLIHHDRDLGVGKKLELSVSDNDKADTSVNPTGDWCCDLFAELRAIDKREPHGRVCVYSDRGDLMANSVYTQMERLASCDVSSVSSEDHSCMDGRPLALSCCWILRS